MYKVNGHIFQVGPGSSPLYATLGWEWVVGWRVEGTKDRPQQAGSILVCLETSRAP